MLGAVATFGILVAVSIATLVLGLDSLAIGDPDTIWHLLVHEVDPDGGGASFGFGMPLFLLVSGLGGVGYTVFVSVRERRQVGVR